SSRARCARSQVLSCAPLLLCLPRRSRRRLLRRRLPGCGLRSSRPLRGGLRLLLRRLRFPLRLLLRDLLDLYPGEARPAAVVPTIACLRPVLADPHFVTEHVPDHLCRHLNALAAELGFAVAAGEEHSRMERLVLRVRQPGHEQPLALTDAVLLATE